MGFALLLGLIAWSAGRGRAVGAEIPYGVGDWPEALGNHRARIRVAAPAPAVWVHLPWRRRDARPETVEVIVMEASGKRRVGNVLRARVERQAGDLLFEAAAAGEYQVYFLPYRTEGSWYFPTTVYLTPTNTATADWLAAAAPVAERLRRGDTNGIPAAEVLEFQAINDFHRFDPMELVASPAERAALVNARGNPPYLLFPEDRRYPIRMTDELPLRWVKAGPGTNVVGEAARGEFFTWQIGWFAAGQAADELAVAFTDLESPAGGRIPRSAMRCFNLAGTNWLGAAIRKSVSVPKGAVQPLWFGVDVPRGVAPGRYRGAVTLSAARVPATTVTLDLTVTDAEREDGGDGELWRQARLRWLDSTIGLDDEVFPPYLPVTRQGEALAVLGRDVRVGASGLPASVASRFTPNVDGVNGPPLELLAAPMRFVVEDAAGRAVDWRADGLRWERSAPGKAEWVATNRADGWTLVCRGSLECDGYVNLRLTLRAEAAGRLTDARFELPVARERAKYFMGLGHKGGVRPAEWKWAWDLKRSNNQFWIGDVSAGLSCKLKHVEDRWDLYNLQESGLYRDWANGGLGGCDLRESGPNEVLVRASSGARAVTAGEELHFNVGMLITPVKPLDREHWRWRYFHQGTSAPVAEAAAAGATLINLHQGDALNPYINYPFLTTDKLSAYTREAHERGMRVKLYYTIRELSNYAAEFWALRSLGHEVYAGGAGFRLADQFAAAPAGAAQPTGSSWLCEHVIRDYAPAWHQPLGNGHYDAAIATTGLSRWHNYYLEGLNWLVRNVGIDGLYLDGVGYDREIMKRVRKVLSRARPGCLIDFHSGNNFHADYGLNNCANQYLELFPCLDSLWFGEGFDYNESPDYWLIEVAGIPYGLFGEMLHGGGNPWRGMVYGMTVRLGWSGDPRGLWKLWDSFGIADARMIGYWDPACPVKTGRDDVLATVYQRAGRSLVALASWAPGPTNVTLAIDFERLGLDPRRTHVYAPRIAGFQGERLWNPGEPIAVPAGRGWLLQLDEEPRTVAQPATLGAGRKALLADPLTGPALDPAWTQAMSKQPGTKLEIVADGLRVEALANAAAFVERPLPAGSRVVSVRIDPGSDGGASWGPGLSLVWPEGRVLRANVRAEGRFGADDGRRQWLEGSLAGRTWTRLAFVLDAQEVVGQGTQDEVAWQEIIRVPRAEFPGDPVAVRLGKMSPGSRNEDFSTLGPSGACTFRQLEVWGD